VSKADGPLATIVSPGALGGANWPGGSYDPDTHILYVYSRSDISALGLVPSPDPKLSDMEYVQGTANVYPHPGRPMGAPPVPAPNPESGEPVLTVRGLPLLKPPYGRITAINLDKGEIIWQIAHGETPDNVRNNPALAGLTILRTGSQGLIGVLTTKTLVIAGEGVNVTMPSGMRGAMLRGYDKATGKDAGAVYMPAPQSGSPMTYMLNGQQYIVIAVSGPGYPGELIAYRLPPN
jgi:quinoprotein glucose dehydrogenase